MTSTKNDQIFELTPPPIPPFAKMNNRSIVFKKIEFTKTRQTSRPQPLFSVNVINV